MPRVPWSADALPQPEEAIFFLLTPDNKTGLTDCSLKAFFFRMLFLFFFFTVFKFLLIESAPSFMQGFLIVAIYTLSTLFIIFFLFSFNKSIRIYGVKGLLLLLLFAVVII